MRKIISVVAMAVAWLVVFTGTAFAAQATGVPDAGELIELAKPVYQAIMSGQYWSAAALALVVVCGAIRAYLAPRVPFFRTDAGGTLLLLLASFGGAVATLLAAAGLTAPTWQLCVAAFGVAASAAGGYTMVKRLALPVLAWLERLSPPWLKPLFQLVPWLFDVITGAGAVRKAEDAGAAAVAAKPSTGAAGVVGTPRDVE